MPAGAAAPALSTRQPVRLLTWGGVYASTAMFTVFSVYSPRLSVTRNTKGTVPEPPSSPVCRVALVPEYPPPRMLYPVTAAPYCAAAPVILAVQPLLPCTYTPLPMLG